MPRGMSILHQWDATGRANRSNGLAEGHNGSLTSENPYFQLCRPGLSSKLPLRGENLNQPDTGDTAANCASVD